MKNTQTNYFLALKILIGIFISAFVSSCYSEGLIKRQSSDAVISKPRVLTTFTILADIASNIAGEELTVNSITKHGAEIHGYQPTPSDLVRASKVDLIIENGFGLELWAEKFTKSLGSVPSVVLTKGMKPILIEGDIYAGKPNPHAWMSPIRTIAYVDNIVEAFSDLKPDSRKIFIDNANLYKEKLLQLDKDLRMSINSIPRSKRVLVTCEGAFSYLAKDYGLDELYLWPVNAESQVTPRRMQNLIEAIQNRNIPTIFCESTVSSKHQKEVARSSGSKFGGTFYVDSLSGADGPAPTLLQLQRHNVRLIQEGLKSNP